jgi:hypothetical protein
MRRCWVRSNFCNHSNKIILYPSVSLLNMTQGFYWRVTEVLAIDYIERQTVTRLSLQMISARISFPLYSYFGQCNYDNGFNILITRFSSALLNIRNVNSQDAMICLNSIINTQTNQRNNILCLIRNKRHRKGCKRRLMKWYFNFPK